MHSHDRSVLASMGFNDPDRQNTLHGLACRYLALPESVKLLREVLAGEKEGARSVSGEGQIITAQDDVYDSDTTEFMLMEQSGRRVIYRQFIDSESFGRSATPHASDTLKRVPLKSGAFAGTITTTIRCIESECERPIVRGRYGLHSDSRRVIGFLDVWCSGETRSTLVGDYPFQCHNLRDVPSNPTDTPQIGAPRNQPSPIFRSAAARTRQEWMPGELESVRVTLPDTDRWSYAIEVKIGVVPIEKVLMQINLYRELVTDQDGYPVGWVLATAYPVNPMDRDTLRKAGIHHIRLADGFRQYVEQHKAQSGSAGESPEF